MGIVAMSPTLGSGGDEIGRELARTLGYECADQEIIVAAANRFGEDVRALERFTEEKPALWERFSETRERYRRYVEAVVWEVAARDRAILSGRGAAFVLRPVRHALRVRITAPEGVRVARLASHQGLTPDAAAQLVRQNDRERGARVKLLYRLDWEDPLVYDLVLNTEGLAIPDGVRVLTEALRGERFRPTTEALGDVRDQAAAAGARAALVADARTRRVWVESVECRHGELRLRGMVDREEVRWIVEEIVRHAPAVEKVVNELVVASDGTRGSRAQR
jgi:cytidylate kinase